MKCLLHERTQCRQNELVRHIPSSTIRFGGVASGHTEDWPVQQSKDRSNPVCIAKTCAETHCVIDAAIPPPCSPGTATDQPKWLEAFSPTASSYAIVIGDRYKGRHAGLDGVLCYSARYLYGVGGRASGVDTADFRRCVRGSSGTRTMLRRGVVQRWSVPHVSTRHTIFTSLHMSWDGSAR